MKARYRHWLFAAAKRFPDVEKRLPLPPSGRAYWDRLTQVDRNEITRLAWSYRTLLDVIRFMHELTPTADEPVVVRFVFPPSAAGRSPLPE